MNTVTPIPLKSKFRWTGEVGDLIGDNFDSEKTAFIGSCGAGEETLYLVTYECVSIARCPQSTWESSICTVEVIRFVDVNISIVERKDV